ncbi:MAG: hypothetical protein HZB13_00840 [Acidobacteria bacterium]|nr:hypothetical protein [Acidobacteriota bacterium]
MNSRYPNPPASAISTPAAPHGAGNNTSDPNLSDGSEYILRLIGHFITVSLETSRLTA